MKIDLVIVWALLGALGGCVGGASIPAPIEDRTYRPAAARPRVTPTPPKPVVPARDSNLPVVKALPDPENPLRRATPIGTEPVALPPPASLAPVLPAGPVSTLSPVPGMPTMPDASSPVPAVVPVLPPAGTPLDPSASIARPAAVTALLGAAEQAGKAGRRAEARVKLERGLEIAPRDGELWFRLAQLSAADGDWKQTKSLAERASSLAAAGSPLATLSEALGHQAAAALAAPR